MEQHILGIDIGSSSVRAALFDHSGTMLQNSLTRIGSTLFGADAYAVESEAVLAKTVLAIDMVLKQLRVKSEITHIVSCAFWHSLCGVGVDQKPTTEVFVWADTRSGEYTNELNEEFDEAAVHDRTGARFHSSFWPAKLLWLKSEHRETFEKTAKWLSLSDYVQLKLCGNDSTSVSMASGTGILDQRKCKWDTELLHFLEMDTAVLPKVVEDDSISFELSHEYGERWPQLKNARWLPFIGDGAANNVGSGCVTKNRSALMVGTSGAMRVAYNGEPPANLPPGLWCYRVDRKRVLVGGALSDGGGLYAWIKKRLNVGLSDTEIGEEIARRGADAHGLTLMPFFFGERSTGYQENISGNIFGLSTSHDAIDILQAAMEAVAFRFAEILDQLNEVTTISEIVASGGALDASPVWTQIIADVLGRDLFVSIQPEASLRGTVLLALESLGKIEDIGRTESRLELREFHPKCHDIYKNARSRHDKFYRSLVDRA